MADDPMQIPVTAIHLDAVGGVAGDMFAAALLDVRPDLWSRCEAAIAAMDLPDSISITREPHGDGALTGLRFLVGGVSGQGNGQKLAFIVGGAPQPVSLPLDDDHHLVEVPVVAWPRARTAQVGADETDPNFRNQRRTVS